MTHATAAGTLPFQIGDTTEHRGITVTPLFPATDPVAGYTSLAEATTRGFTVKEVDEAGSVGELVVVNPTDERVLIYDGEEVEGAKQNRIVNVSVLVEAHSDLAIPVSCVEQGRWSWQSESFRAAGRTPSPDVRRAKAEMLMEAPLERGLAQSAVWSAVSAKEAERGFRSASSAHGDLIEHERPRIDDMARHFPLQPGQCGMVLGADGKVVCMDAVSRPDVFAQLHPALLTGYMLDGAHLAGRAAAPQGAVQEFVAAVAGATRTTGPAAGLGEDIRLHGKGVVGSGLVLDGEVIQMTAFARDDRGDGGPVTVTPRIARPRTRQRTW